MFLQKSKIKTVGKRKTMYFSVISIQEFLIFLYGLFQKMLNVSSKHYFNRQSACNKLVLMCLTSSAKFTKNPNNGLCLQCLGTLDDQAIDNLVVFFLPQCCKYKSTQINFVSRTFCCILDGNCSFFQKECYAYLIFSSFF